MFPLSGDRGRRFLLGWTPRDWKFSPLLPDDGNISSFRNVVFGITTMDNVRSNYHVYDEDGTVLTLGQAGYHNHCPNTLLRFLDH